MWVITFVFTSEITFFYVMFYILSYIFLLQYKTCTMTKIRKNYYYNIIKEVSLAITTWIDEIPRHNGHLCMMMGKYGSLDNQLRIINQFSSQENEEFVNLLRGHGHVHKM